MNNEELKKKITEIIGDVYLVNAPIKDVYKPIFMEKIADALIAAGIGDVKTVREIGASAAAMAIFEAAKAEHRAEVAEKALKHAVNVYIAHTETSSKKKWWYKYFLREAEKKLAEENGEKKKI